MTKQMMPIEKIRKVLNDAAGVNLSGGSFKETVVLASNQEITFEFSLAAAWDWSASKSAYQVHFGAVPGWTLSLHPIHRTRLCKLSIHIDQELPKVIDNQTLEFYVSTVLDGGMLKS